MDYTIVICTHNRARVLPRALAAVARLEPPAGKAVELVVVDNASTDGTRDEVREFQGRAPLPVRYVHEPRMGHSTALNTGIAAARGGRVAFTDDDGCPEPGWLTHADRAFERHQADWVFGRVLPIWDGRRPAWYGPHVMPLFALLDYGPESFVVTDPGRTFYGVNNICTREALERLGGYRADLGPMGLGVVGSLGADEDLFRRALAAGCTIVYEPAAAVRHIIPPRRCTRRFHLVNTWRQAGPHYRALQASAEAGPRWLGLPRYYYRLLVEHSVQALKHAARRDRSGAFHHQQRTVRFLALAWQGLRHAAGRH
jgi:glycosyltransferase involved in cell wall biosynthesis